jgi:spore germination protein PC
MGLNSNFETYFQQLHSYLKWQTDRIRYLESRLDRMEKELELIKNQDRIHIDKIEYNFDQLKVETLDGTLNVGISPAGLGAQNIDDLAVGGKTISTNTSRSEAFERIQKRVNSYLDQQFPGELAQLQRQYQLEQEEGLSQKISLDLQGQTGERIQYYMEIVAGPPPRSITPEQEQVVTDDVINDIRSGLDQYLLKLQQQGGGPDAAGQSGADLSAGGK